MCARASGQPVQKSGPGHIYFGGTSLLIIVMVTMDFMAQVQARFMSHQYDGLLKQSNLKGYRQAKTPR